MIIFLLSAQHLLQAFSMLVLHRTLMQSAATGASCYVTVITLDFKEKTKWNVGGVMKCLPIQCVGGCDVHLLNYQCLQQTQLQCTFFHVSIFAIVYYFLLCCSKALGAFLTYPWYFLMLITGHNTSEKQLDRLQLWGYILFGETTPKFSILSYCNVVNHFISLFVVMPNQVSLMLTRVLFSNMVQKFIQFISSVQRDSSLAIFTFVNVCCLVIIEIE